MESEEPDIKSKQASKRDRTLPIDHVATLLVKNLFSYCFLLFDKYLFYFNLISDEPNDATVVTAANTNTRLFTDDANTNNAIAGGLLGNSIILSVYIVTTKIQF